MSSRSGPNQFRSSPSMVSNLTVLKVLRSFRHQTEKDTAAVSDSKYSGQVPVLSLQHGDVLALPFHQLWRGDSQRLLTLWNFETCTMCKPIDGVSSDGYRHSSGQISDAHLLSTTLRQKIDAQQHPQSGMRLDKTSDCGWQQPCLYQYIPVHCENMCKSYANIWLQPKNSMPRAFLSTYSKIQHSKIDALQSGGAAQNSSNRTRQSLSRKYAQTEGLFWNTNNASKCTSDRDAAEVCVLKGNELPHEHYLSKISSTTFKLQAHFPPA